MAAATAVAAGWLLREPAILRAVPGTLMVFNTALGFALAGKKGVAVARDNRERFVIAAYAPIGATGLDMVLEMDIAEPAAPD